MARLTKIISMIVAMFTVMSNLQCAWAKGGTDTGIHASLDLRTLSLGKDVIFDKIIGFIDDVKIPDVQLKGNKGYLIENSFQLA